MFPSLSMFHLQCCTVAQFSPNIPPSLSRHLQARHGAHPTLSRLIALGARSLLVVDSRGDPVERAGVAMSRDIGNGP